MTTTGKTSSADYRNRPARVAPRRHTELSEQVSPGTYDSNEFPVLLRMPDVSHPPNPIAARDTDAVPARGDSRVSTTSSGNSRELSKSTGRTSQHDRAERPAEATPSIESSERRLTSSATIRFWSTVPPQAAAGGMLLAVIALCFVLLRDSNSSKPASDEMTEWSSGTPQATQDQSPDTPPAAQSTASPTFTADGQANRESVAAKPAAPRLAPVPLGEPTPAQPVSVQSATAWPTSANTTSWPVPAVETDVTPVQSWPNGQAATAEGADTLLNAPAGSSEVPIPSSLRTSQRTARPTETTTTPSLDAADSSPLDGTIEIPPPTKINPQ